MIIKRNSGEKDGSRFIFWHLVMLLMIAASCSISCSTNHAPGDHAPRIRQAFNDGWRFQLGDDSLYSQPEYNDSTWRALSLPHDWSIEGAFSEEHPSGTAGGALPTGTGWYRKTFRLPAASEGKSIYIDFDGSYRNSEIWINGHYLGKRPSGYSSFRYELTSYLNFGEQPNTIAVRVDNSAQPASRWYTGSGIYRNVWLVSTGTVHVDHWGAFVTNREVSESEAGTALEIALRNVSEKPVAVRVETIIYDQEGKKAGAVESLDTIAAGPADTIHQQLSIANPRLWSVADPYLYKAVIHVYKEGAMTDRYEVPFGIRYFEFDAEKGFSLNGEAMKILGVCLHHDLGALGAAVNSRAIERQLEILKEMGCNAIRTAHNPPAPELLELCDRMGLLVMDESFDVWAKKKKDEDYHLFWDEWHQTDLAAMVRRDRNHPSIFSWSIGNEIREQFDSTGISMTRELVHTVKQLDPTRPVICALTENYPEKNFIYQAGALDLLGFNYKQEAYADLPQRFPGGKFIATETTSGLASRGHYDLPSDSAKHWPPAYDAPFDGNPDYTVSAYDRISAYWGSTHEETWKEVKKLDHMAGLFVWTGFDYLGEPVPYPWPARSSYFGIVDLAGFPKDVYYMYKSEWSDESVLHIFPHWNWERGKTVDVWAYYNKADEVELFLNGNSLGVRKKEGDQLHVMWQVKYEPGLLKAVSRKDGKIVLEREIRTAGPAARIELKADRNRIKADGNDLSFITVQITDKEGNLVPDAANEVTFNVSGAGRLAGVDNGYQASLESFKVKTRKAFNGKCLAIVQSEESAGQILIEASSPGLQSASLKISVQ